MYSFRHPSQVFLYWLLPQKCLGSSFRNLIKDTLMIKHSVLKSPKSGLIITKAEIYRYKLLVGLEPMTFLLRGVCSITLLQPRPSFGNMLGREAYKFCQSRSFFRPPFSGLLQVYVMPSYPMVILLKAVFAKVHFPTRVSWRATSSGSSRPRWRCCGWKVGTDSSGQGWPEQDLPRAMSSSSSTPIASVDRLVGLQQVALV